MPRAPRRCPVEGCDHRFTGTRNTCPEHSASPTSRASWDRAERRRRILTIQAWVRANGWVCPGYRRGPHPSRDLTAAHTTAVAQGGKHSPLLVLCRPCNSMQGVNPT